MTDLKILTNLANTNNSTNSINPYSIITTWIISFIVIILISQKYNNCEHRIPITYLILSFSLASFIALQYLLIYYKINTNLIVAFLFSITFLVSTHFSPAHSIQKKVLFSLFIISMSYILLPLFKLADKLNVAKPAILIVLLLFVSLTIISSIYPNMITLKWGNYLFFALLGLLIVRIVFIFTKPSNKLIQLSSYIGIIIFSGYILYDSKWMRWRASQCEKKYDYIDNIIGLFLDFVNLLSDTMALGITNK